MKYKVCPDCGAHLDPGERCDCGAKKKSRSAGTETALDDEGMTRINLIYHPSSLEGKSQALLPPAYRPREAAEAQVRFCERNGYLLFAPRSGYCYKCRSEYLRTIKEQSRGYNTRLHSRAGRAHAHNLLSVLPYVIYRLNTVEVAS